MGRTETKVTIGRKQSGRGNDFPAPVQTSRDKVCSRLRDAREQSQQRLPAMSSAAALPTRKFTTTLAVRAIFAGLLSGAICILFAVSFANLVFAGALAPYVAIGLGMALFGGTVIAFVIATGSSYRGSVGGVSSEIAILSVVVATYVNERVGTAAPEQLLATAILIMTLSSFLAGLVYLGLGRARLGNLIRYIPYPVIGGFIAGVGWLLVVGAIGVGIGSDQGTSLTAAVMAPGDLLRWLPAALLGGILLFIQRRTGSFLTIPGVLILAAAGTYLTGLAAGIGVSGLRTDGWLLGPIPTSSGWAPWIAYAQLGAADWSEIAAALPGIATYTVTVVIGLLLVGTSLELISRQDVELNKELQVAGIANIAGALGGGFPGYHYIASTTLHHQVGANTRVAGLTAGVLCALTLMAGLSVLEYVPRVVAATLLFYIGFGLLQTWLIDSARRLRRTDYLVVLTVFAFVVLVGLMEGVLIGLILGLAQFAYNYSRIDVVRRELTASTLRSRVARPASEINMLRRLGEGVVIYRLDGFIFFGTVNRLLERIRRRASDGPDKLHSVILDFRNVRGIDSSAATYFSRLISLADRRNFHLALASVAPNDWNALEREGVRQERRLSPRTPNEERRRTATANQASHALRFRSLDDALEWCENRLLLDSGFDASAVTERSFTDANWVLFSERETTQQFMRYSHTETFAPGETLVAQGQRFRKLYFILSGNVDVSVTAQNGERVRLRNMGAGACVGEISMYLGMDATADVIAHTETVTIAMTQDDLDNLRREAPETYARLHETLAHTLAARLADNNRLIDNLLH